MCYGVYHYHNTPQLHTMLVCMYIENMNKKTITTFSFSELSDEAKAKAIQNNYDINTDYEWWEDTSEMYSELLSEYGFENFKLYFSGFSSQGDGACFEATMDCEGMKKFIENNKLKTKFNLVYKAIQRKDEKGIYVNISIKHDGGRYYHEYMTDLHDYSCMQTEDELTCDTKLGTQWVDLISFIDDRTYNRTDRTKNNGAGWLIGMNRTIYRTLEREFDFLTSDEAIAETLKANKYEFLSDGSFAY